MCWLKCNRISDLPLADTYMRASALCANACTAEHHMDYPRSENLFLVPLAQHTHARTHAHTHAYTQTRIHTQTHTRENTRTTITNTTKDTIRTQDTTRHTPHNIANTTEQTEE